MHSQFILDPRASIPSEVRVLPIEMIDGEPCDLAYDMSRSHDFVLVDNTLYKEETIETVSVDIPVDSSLKGEGRVAPPWGSRPAAKAAGRSSHHGYNHGREPAKVLEHS